MGNLHVTFRGENPDKESKWSMVGYDIANIECEDVLEGLAILHERLNTVAMPRIHQGIKSTAGADVADLVTGLQADDKFLTISC